MENPIDKIKKEVEILKGNEGRDELYDSIQLYENEREATNAFLNAKRKLFDVNRWSDIPGIGNAAFKLYDPNGESSNSEKPEINYFIRIDLPGPLPIYWVEIIDLKEEEEFAEFTARPCADPTDKREEKEIMHFFHEGARSIFHIERRGNSVYAAQIGINEAINNQGQTAGSNSLVNTVVAEGGWAFFQKLQWKNLTDYLVKVEKVAKGDNIFEG